MAAITVWNGAARLGEAPCWDPRDKLLSFVDIKGRRVHRYDPQSGRTQAWDAPAPIGWVLPAESGALLAGLQTGLARFDAARETSSPSRWIRPGSGCRSPD
jgi:sugar lactone lactonase YvrE